MQKLWFCSGFEFLEMGSFLEKVVLSFFSSKHNNDIMYNYKPPPPYFMPYITRYYSYSNFPMTPMYMYYKTPYMHDRFSGSVEINLSHKSEGAELPPTPSK